LLSAEDDKIELKDARKVQKIDDGIDAQRQVFDVPATRWSHILAEGVKRKFLTPKEVGVLKIAEQMPSKIPTELQSAVLVSVLRKAQQEGIV
jgi:hypothetical protein